MPEARPGWSRYNGKTAVAFRPAKMSPQALWEGYQWFRRRFFSRRGILERLRRSGVRKAQSWVLNMVKKFTTKHTKITKKSLKRGKWGTWE